MNKTEAKILHGLYFHREMIGEEMIYSAAEINWLANVSFGEANNWQNSEGHLQSLETENDDYLVIGSNVQFPLIQYNIHKNILINIL